MRSNNKRTFLATAFKKVVSSRRCRLVAVYPSGVSPRLMDVLNIARRSYARSVSDVREAQTLLFIE
jgi:hypothetical protein